MTISTESGDEGTGNYDTGGKGGRAIHAVIEHEIKPALIGQDASDIEAVYDWLEWHTHYVGDEAALRALPTPQWTSRRGISAAGRPACRCGRWPAAPDSGAKPASWRN